MELETAGKTQDGGPDVTMTTIAKKANDEAIEFWYPPTANIMPDKEALMIIELQKTVQNQRKAIVQLEEENNKLRKTLDTYESDDNNKTSKKRKLRKDQEKKDDSIDQNTDELRNEVNILTEKLGEREAALTETREKLAEMEWTDEIPKASPTQLYNSIESIIDKQMQKIEVRFSTMEKALEQKQRADTNVNTDKQDRDTDRHSKIETLIDSQMKKMEERFTMMEKKIEQKHLVNTKEVCTEIIDKKLEKKIDKITSSTHYSDALMKNIDTNLIGNVVIAAKNTEKVQEHERTRRENNIIIYGAAEGESDESYINDFLATIGASVKPQSISRLGKADEKNKTRPIKLVMGSTDEKSQIMLRLVNLKNADEKFRATSVRDDHSLEERKLIKEWVQIAEEQNKAENTDEYRVRGSPKNGLRTVRVTKKTTMNTETPRKKAASQM